LFFFAAAWRNKDVYLYTATYTERDHIVRPLLILKWRTDRQWH